MSSSHLNGLGLKMKRRNLSWSRDVVISLFHILWICEHMACFRFDFFPAQRRWDISKHFGGNHRLLLHYFTRSPGDSGHAAFCRRIPGSTKLSQSVRRSALLRRRIIFKVAIFFYSPELYGWLVHKPDSWNLLRFHCCVPGAIQHQPPQWKPMFPDGNS